MIQSVNISDEKLTETWLTKMTAYQGIVFSVLGVIFTAIFLFASFTPESTITKIGHSSTIATPVSTAYIRVKMDDYDSLSSIALFRISPRFVPASVDRNVVINIKGKAVLLDNNEAQIDEINISDSISYNVPTGFNDYTKAETFLTFSSIKFNSIIFYLDVSTINEIILDVELKSTSFGTGLSLSGIISISIVTVIVGIVLIGLISRRIPPAEKDQWCILILSGIMFLVDGPWLLCQYYAVEKFSQVFDIMPQLFHGFFVIYAFIFFSSKTRETPKFIFNNYIILVCLFILQIIVIILEFSITKMNPLAAFAYYRQTRGNNIFISLAVIFCVYHLIIICSFIYGFIIAKFERQMSLIITIFMFFILEASQLVTSMIRLFVNEKLIGTSLAADIFYILEANLFVAILLYLTTPLSRSKDNVKYLIDE